MPARLTHHAYGKSKVRLTRVVRRADRHDLLERTVGVQLEGDFAASYTEGDNAGLVATDTMKNLVYALALGRPDEPIESFGLALAAHFLESYPQVESAEIQLEEAPWARIAVDGRDHPHAFVGGGSERRTARVRRDRSGISTTSGLSGLLILKTTRSAFRGFHRDRYTTLPEADDRILATELSADWIHANGAKVDHDAEHARARRALLETFADHVSLSVQQTLHAMGLAVLNACPAILEITLTMPNQHRIPFDLARFGVENSNEIFVATDEPHGLITGTLRREPTD